MKKLLLCAILPAAFFTKGIAQPTFFVHEYVDINKIKAAVQLHGDLWWDPSTMNAACEFPKGTNKHLQHASSVWLGGYDANNDLHFSAQTYRQDGNDYWPGPLDAAGTLTMATSTKWARVWKLNRTTLDSFVAQSTHTTANTPKVILEWPAKGNPTAGGSAGLVITEDMAPFVDVNSDGVYNALQGDYPVMKGDQMIWWVFSDNGPTHNNVVAGAPLSKTLKVQVHACAYAYSRGTLIDNVVYYEYDVINKSSEDYDDFRFGLWSDVDLGGPFDDYIGFDSTHRMGYVYNRLPNDAVYGSVLPVSGVTFLEMPRDNASAAVPAGSFMFYENGNGPLGNPGVDTQYNHYLRSKFRNSTPLKRDYSGPGITAWGTGTGPETKYIWPDNPNDNLGWSECKCAHPGGDRRFVISTNDHAFLSGTKAKIAFALLVTDTATNNACGNVNITGITTVADTAWHIYKNPLPPPVTDINQMTVSKHSLKVYPNPAYDRLFVERANNYTGKEQVMIYDAMGRIIKPEVKYGKEKIEINTAALPAGIYHILYRNDTEQSTNVFIKE